MGELLSGESGVVAIRDTFPVGRRGGKVIFAVVMELAAGDLAHAVMGRGWPQGKVIVETRRLLTAIQRLHASGAVHRDITPLNVFVYGDEQTVKLGDFGIARHGFSAKGVAADVFNEYFAEPALLDGDYLMWGVRNDLWQVGQLAAMMLTGNIKPIGTKDVKHLPCSGELKMVIRRAIGEPAFRYRSATAMLNALASNAVPFRIAKLRRLRGRRIVITGPLRIPRKDAIRLAENHGASVLTSASALMDTLVIGDASPNWIAGNSGGVKVLETIALIERKHAISIIDGVQFERLIGVG
jgi:serine/threonine-protein kinase